jgi:hypothetical protein
LRRLSGTSRKLAGDAASSALKILRVQQALLETHGIEGLLDLPPVRKKSHLMSTSKEVREKIAALSLSHPAHGAVTA